MQSNILEVHYAKIWLRQKGVWNSSTTNFHQVNGFMLQFFRLKLCEDEDDADVSIVSASESVVMYAEL